MPESTIGKVVFDGRTLIGKGRFLLSFDCNFTAIISQMFRKHPGQCRGYHQVEINEGL
jgi:hypothetical protein